MDSMAREAWTDERLDDLKLAVDDGFRGMREEFRALRAEMQAFREEMRAESQALREETKTESLAVRKEIAAMHLEIHQFAFALVGALLVGFLGTIVAIVSLV